MQDLFVLYYFLKICVKIIFCLFSFTLISFRLTNLQVTLLPLQFLREDLHLLFPLLRTNFIPPLPAIPQSGNHVSAA